jgi:protein-disulfide isomerase
MSFVADLPRLTVPVGERDHVRGPETAPLTLVEYGDYECPFCAAAHVEVSEVIAILGAELRFAFRHFPLAQIHPHAQQAAEAAEAAGVQNRFWEMHEILFAHQHRLGLNDLLGYADGLHLDVTRFALELETHFHGPRIREDFISGVRSGVNGTPTFFVNGFRHNGANDAATLIAALESAL